MGIIRKMAKSEHIRTSKTKGIRKKIVKILIKWNMPTRQSAIIELAQFVEQSLKKQKEKLDECR